MPKSTLLIALLIALPACAGPVPVSPSAVATAGAPRVNTGDRSAVAEGSLSPFAAAMLSKVNALRAAGGACGEQPMPPAPPLRWNQALALAAQRHAEDMHRNQFFGHTGADGSTLVSRVRATGYDFGRVAENIAYGDRDLNSTVERWRSSPGHCQNMKRANFSDLGAARAGGYWVQVFGTRN